MKCKHCGGNLSLEDAFCPHCGHKYNPCPKCGTDNSEHAKRCVSCGTPLGGGEGSAGASRNCPNCGTPLAPGAQFCGNCGTRVGVMDENRCTRCGTELQPSAKFCPVCGNRR